MIDNKQQDAYTVIARQAKRAGLTVGDIARITGIPYDTVWKMLNHGQGLSLWERWNRIIACIDGADNQGVCYEGS